MLKIKPTLATLAGLTILISCSGKAITTWIVNGQDATTPFHHDAGNVHDRASVVKADKMRCYSKQDDQYIRTLLAQYINCCQGH